MLYVFNLLVRNERIYALFVFLIINKYTLFNNTKN